MNPSYASQDWSLTDEQIAGERGITVACAYQARRRWTDHKPRTMGRRPWVPPISINWTLSNKTLAGAHSVSVDTIRRHRP